MGGRSLVVVLLMAAPAAASPKLRDLDGDGVAERIDHGHVWQLRYGAWMEVGAELAACGAGGTDRRAAIDGFVAAVERGEEEGPLRCLYGDALAAAGIEPVSAPWPDRGTAMTIAPIAAECPATDWAARHGRAIAPRRTIVFASSGALARIETDDAGMSVTRAGLVPIAAIRDLSNPIAERVEWIQPWVLDDHLWAVAQLAIAGAHDVHAHYVVVYDPSTNLLVAGDRVRAREQATVEIGKQEPGAFEVVIAGPNGRRVAWHRDTLTWGP